MTSDVRFVPAHAVGCVARSRFAHPERVVSGMEPGDQQFTMTDDEGRSYVGLIPCDPVAKLRGTGADSVDVPGGDFHIRDNSGSSVYSKTALSGTAEDTESHARQAISRSGPAASMIRYRAYID